MARLYANENFPLPVVEELRRLGHEVLTTYEAGDAGNQCRMNKYWLLPLPKAGLL